MQRAIAPGVRALPWIAAAGLCTGLCFLTKAEVFVGCAGAVAVASALAPGAARERVRRAIVLLAGAAFPVAAAFALLATAMPVADAWRGTIGSWYPMLFTDVSKLAFFESGMGADAPGENVRRLFAWAGYEAIVLVAVVGACALPVRTLRSRAVAAVVLFAVPIAAARWFTADVRWEDVARPWPLLTIGLAAFWFVAWWRARSDAQAGPQVSSRAALCVFGFLMLGKMLANRLDLGSPQAVAGALAEVESFNGQVEIWRP
jgi:hypothetical protein